jgi:hypothetical protein
MWTFLKRIFSRSIGPQTSKSNSADLAFCAVFRDEAPYLDEWIRFHHGQGVSHFYLYDHESSDEFEQALSPWQAQGIVTLLQVQGRHQEDVYTECLELARNSFSWLGFLDIDEFLFSPKEHDLIGILNRYVDFAGVFVFWQLFGSAGRDLQSPRGVIESFTYCLELPKSPNEAQLQYENWVKLGESGKPTTGNPIQGKCLVNLAKVTKMSIHFPEVYKGKVVDEQMRVIDKKSDIPTTYTSKYSPSANELRINHYWSRGNQALIQKFSKPGIARNPRDPDSKKLIDAALERESGLNSSRDMTILKQWRRTSAPRIFLIGFNKTATRAFSAFFDGNGVPAVHWDENKMAQVMAANISKGLKVLDGYDSQFKFYSDFISLTESEKIEGNAFFKEMDLHYPGSYFILNNRETSSWILSRELHNQGVFFEKNKSIMQTGDPKVVRAKWRIEKETHEKEVREYFKDRKDFIEIDIDLEDIPQRLEKFLDMEFDHSLWQVVGKT